MDLAVQKREILGRRVKELRRQGLVPAELYGRGVDNLHLAVPEKDFHKVFKQAGENQMVSILIDGETRPVLIYEINRDAVTDEILNVDFYQVRMDEKLQVKVPVEFVGESPAVKAGNILVKAIQEIEVEALPGNIPHSFIVDISGLTEVGQDFKVKNLVIDKNVKILVESESVIATIQAPLTEEEEKALEEQAVPGVEAVKVETEEKKAEREKEKVETSAPQGGASADKPASQPNEQKS